MPTRTFAQRLRAARLDANMTLDQIGRGVGVTAQAVYKWERGPGMPSSDKISRLAAMLNTTPDYLLTGTESVRHYVNHTVGGGRRTVPVFAPSDIASGTMDSPVGQAATHFSCGPNSYAVTLWDSSNAPRYAAGDQVVIDSAVVAEPGDMVLAVIDGRPVFAQFETASTNGTRHVVLRPTNEKWAPHTLTESDAKDSIRGVMTEHATPRRR